MNEKEIYTYGYLSRNQALNENEETQLHSATAALIWCKCKYLLKKHLRHPQ